MTAGNDPPPKAPSGPKKSPPSYAGNQYQGHTTVSPAHNPPDEPGHISIPPVPSGDKSKQRTSVDTPSLQLFADNVRKLVAPVTSAAQALQEVGVKPGGFYHGNKIRTDVDGANEDGGLKESFLKALSDVTTGLTDLGDRMTELSSKYTTIEDANHMTATDLQNAMADSTADFNLMTKDNGGAGSSGASSGSGSTS